MCYRSVGHICYKNKCPRNGERGQFFERRSLFSKDYWIGFQGLYGAILKWMLDLISDIGHTWFSKNIIAVFHDIG